VTSPLPLIDGLWQMIRAERDGEGAPDEATRLIVIELRDGEYFVRLNGETVDQGTFELGGVVDTRTMLLRGITGPNAGRTIPCLLQLRGDRLRVCYGMNGIAPTEFATQMGDERYLAVYQRTP
jgi:uncharacterized protein (TIGR03067 family)